MIAVSTENPNTDKSENSNPAVKACEVPQRSTASTSTRVLCGLAIIGAMYIARDLLIPLVFAVLLALLLRPLLRHLRKLHLPDLASAALLVLSITVLVLLSVATLAGQAQEWLTHAPDVMVRVGRMLPVRTGPFVDFQKAKAAVNALTTSVDGPKTIPVEISNPDLAISVLGVSGHVVAATIIVLVVAFFVLGLSDMLLKQAVESRPLFYQKKNIVQLVHNVEFGISRYLLTVTLVNIGLGVVTALVMWALQIPNPILWGVMATTLNYIPHVGAFIGMAVLFFVGAMTHESLSYGGLVAGCFAAITCIESYFVTPMTLSRSLQLSPLAVILSILFWVWLWGIPGGLLAAPLLAVIKIICDQFEITQPLGVILGEAVPRSRRSVEAASAIAPAQHAA